VAFYVTTPIYYVNAQPHLGHAYTTIAADVLARHMRQRGEEVFFLTGTDEHGEPVAQVAEREGISPRELADRNVVHFQRMVERLDLTNDFFIRTTDPEHEAEVQRFMQRIYDRGDIYEGVYEGWYCPYCADFKTDQELLDGNRCPIHKIVLERVREQNWFFRLSSYQERLEQLYAEQPEFVMPRIRYNEAVSFIKGGLEDVSVSRPKLQWGVRVPWDESQVFYVWFDALLNYWTALKYARPGEDLTERFWPPSIQLIGKDILKFHAVFWPAMLMAGEVELPRHLFVHGYLLMQGEKMSKTLGNVLDPFQVIDMYGTDALRYYCFREVSFGQDGSISTEGFEARYTTELANEYGNLASRTLAMVGRYRDGRVPEAAPSAALAGDFDGLADAVGARLDRAELTLALEEIWSRVRRLNRYVEEQAPWNLAKDDAQSGRLDEVLYSLAEGLRVVTVLLYPYVPDSAGRLLEALGQRDPDAPALDGARFGARAGGARIEPLPQLFPKVEPETPVASA
jgi:methionyl-tRNA synthetase